ncbi:unnamed protein product [Microthlaspi erraticum]|uniref:Uncharacterized protein n=1 Tax=Microthlaspi erraticum TaxID=1685480 RepID=A0A6D2L1L7_9BRAS|nr:unnamed protein product [Microthlaspi erraticum]CAA7061272.1 unnamed protein product [Microthlaspi erraticum]
MWKAMRGALPVGENLRARNVNTAVRCPHCGDEETTLHLLFQCDYAQEVWKLIPCTNLLNPHTIQQTRKGMEESRKLVCLPPTGVGSGPISPWVLCSLWKSRNRKAFNGTERQYTPEETMTQAVASAREWQRAQLNEEANCARPRLVTKPPIRLEATRCNSDAAWVKETKIAGLGWVFTNARADQLGHGSTSECSVRSALMAEALAVLRSLQQAREIGHNYLSVVSDSQKLIEAINRGNPSKEIHGIHHDILEIARSFSSISFYFVSRDENVLADRIAKNALVTHGQRPI